MDARATVVSFTLQLDCRENFVEWETRHENGLPALAG
jgi:hypothetical protein